ncbi:DUF58 domain-containing protein [Candidatus Woesearchaeota archaeon]|nr:DUF58 domain-containing protein [Candidatus Woesearchaeota archaeon]
MKEIKLDILPLIKKLETFLKKGFSHDLMAGNYLSVYKGKGMEFVGFREYSPSDDAMLIDWKASLRAHKPMVRVLQEERNLTVFFLMDVSDSMLTGSHSKLKCEYAAEMIATLSYAIQQVGDNVGIAMFNDKVVDFIPPSPGRHQFYQIVRSLKNPEHYGGKFDISYALEYLVTLGFLEKDSIVFLISDFIGMKPGWDHTLKLAGLKYDLTAIVVRDPVDLRMPSIPGEFELRDPLSGNQLLINPVEAKEGYEREVKKQLAVLQSELKKTASNYLLLETDQEFVNDIITFFRRRLRTH